MTAKGTNSNKKKPLNPLNIVWGNYYDEGTQIFYYSLNAVVTNRDTQETKQYSFTGETREEILIKLFKKLGYDLKESFQGDLWESR